MSWTAATRTRRDVRRVRWSRARRQAGCARARVDQGASRLQELRLLELRGRRAPRVLVRVLAERAARSARGCRAAAPGCRCPRSPSPSRTTGGTASARMPQNGTTSGLRPGASAGCRMRAPIVRASTSAVTFATWWSPNATSQSTWCAGVPGIRVVGHVLRRSRRPRPGPRASARARSRRCGRARRGTPGSGSAWYVVEVDAALQQRAVVHRRDAEHRVRPLGRDRGDARRRGCRPGCCRRRRPCRRAPACAPRRPGTRGRTRSRAGPSSAGRGTAGSGSPAAVRSATFGKFETSCERRDGRRRCRPRRSRSTSSRRTRSCARSRIVRTLPALTSSLLPSRPWP